MSESDGSPVPNKRRRLDDYETSNAVRSRLTKRTNRVLGSPSQYDYSDDDDDDVPILVPGAKPTSTTRRDSRSTRTATESANEGPSYHGDKALQELRRKNAIAKKFALPKDKVPKPKKPKHRIIVHDKSVHELEDLVATQLPPDNLSSSPWKERGAIIQKRPPKQEWRDPYPDSPGNLSDKEGLGLVPSSPPAVKNEQAELMYSAQDDCSQQKDHTGVGKLTTTPSRSRSRPNTGMASDADDDEDAFSTFISRSQRMLRANPSKANAGVVIQATADERGWEKEAGTARRCDEEPFDESNFMDIACAEINDQALASGEPAALLHEDNAKQSCENLGVQSSKPSMSRQPVQNNVARDIEQELADIPSDEFDDEDEFMQAPRPQRASDPIILSSNSSTLGPQKVVVAPRRNLVQKTLSGALLQVESGPVQATQGRQLNYIKDMPPEPPTHHELSDGEALKSWIYPTNLGAVRDYQFNIVSRCLFSNTLVALPTGLGKTFIAATIMLNWYRWTKNAQIYFVAPTKPLVSQQVEACFGIAGIPYSDTSLLMGTVAPGLRAEEYKTKRVFFMTPQTIVNDFKTGIADPKRVVLLVVDEAHRATGAYAYVELVQFIRRFNRSFRVLALTATPGASVESVQQVMDGLDIAKVEIRHEGSLDIKAYVHGSQIDSIIFDNTPELEMIMDLCSKSLKPVLSQLNQFNAYWAKDPMQLTAFGLTDARKRWMNTAGKSASFAIKGMVNRIFTVLSSLAHNVSLLKFHGIGPFYHNMVAFRSSVAASEKGSKYEKIIVESESFRKMMSTMQFWINNPTFIGHPKLEELQNLVVMHFLNAGKDSPTRVMIFAAFRDSAEEIVRVLRRNTPEVRPHVFVGQAASKGSEGMDQKTQLDIMQKFKDGQYNVLVATSIGEEGLDIGQVDLIVCYDSSGSPIRMLQRMGRTGRKRAGRVYLLLMRGKEEESLAKAKDNYKKIQSMIEDGKRFHFHDDRSLRILPREHKPVPDRREVEIPAENSQAGLPIPSKGRGRAPKRPPKKYHMPDNVQTGFMRASGVGENGEVAMLGPAKAPAGARARGAATKKAKMLSEILEQIPLLEDVLLTPKQTNELDRKYRKVYDNVGQHQAEIGAPDIGVQTEAQRKLRPTKLIGHGNASLRFTKVMSSMYNIDDKRTGRWKAEAHKIDLDQLCGDIALPDSAVPPAKAGAAVRKKDASRQAAEEMTNASEAAGPAKSRARVLPKPKAKSTAGGRQRQPRTGARTVDLGRADYHTSKAMEAPSSSAPMTSQGMALPTQGEDVGSEDTEGEDESESEMDSELADWIVGSDEDIEMEASSGRPFDSSLPTAQSRLNQLEKLFDDDTDGDGPADARVRQRRLRVVDDDSDSSDL